MNSESALDAVEAAVIALENDPTFNAGYGSALNREGMVEMDSAIMRGPDLAAGAVAAIRGVANPISLARKVMAEGEAVLLASEGALQFAVKHGTPILPLSEMVSAAQYNQWLSENKSTGECKDTVGCLALDQQGTLVAGTSTGGLSGKHSGRIGDSPLIGSGLYANKICAVCATGDGEAIMKVVLSREIARLVEGGMHPQSAAEAGIKYMAESVHGEAGCIVLDKHGEIGIAHNSEHLSFAVVDATMREPMVALHQSL
ncbi:MAG: Asparaginase [Verrucomicrobiaceae bacterium]|nr:Asparaginase [Verrucomicrobiaceae bacterium]